MTDESFLATEMRALKLRVGDLERHATPIGMKDISVRVYNSGNLTIGNAATTTLTFNSERYDTDGMHSTTSNTSRLTCTVAGKYIISASVAFASNATGERILYIQLNAGSYIAVDGVPAFATGTTFVTITTEYNLEVGDYVELRVRQNSGGDLAVNAVGNYTPEFMMVKVA